MNYDREELVSRLAVVSHSTYIRHRQERGQEYEEGVHSHDVERAEDIVNELERLGLVGRSARHWHKEPPPSSSAFVANTPLTPTPKGLKAVIELTAYRKGEKAAVATSSVEGGNHDRRIRQEASLMFNDIDEAKDVLDMIADHLANAAKE